jgi:hypothetical protein
VTQPFTRPGTQADSQQQARSSRVEIGTLRLHLPASWHERAAGLTRLIGEELANKPWSASIERESLSLHDLQLPVGASDRELAVLISSAIFARAERSESGGEHG